ncbi:MAG TPA: hypothetical protein VEI02_09815, partial [Planctomycetota bacterium]|nr:hypothetical protein [Planctomycetota bacterium]
RGAQCKRSGLEAYRSSGGEANNGREGTTPLLPDSVAADGNPAPAAGWAPGGPFRPRAPEP